MSTLKFADSHNLDAFLEKPKESDGFEEIIDFLNASSVQYALTVNPTILSTSPVLNCYMDICLWLDSLCGTKGNQILLHAATIYAELEDWGPQKKKSRKKQRKDNAPTEPITEETTHEEHVSTPSYDPPQSGENRMKLTEFMDLYAQLQSRVLDLEKSKTTQAKEITSLKKRVN
ncbi:hypothetical protein Tco_0806121 [Tanacetum coccineum]